MPTPPHALTGGVALLERAISYTLGCLRLVTAEAMANPTPCRDWDLRALLAHLDDALTALGEAAESGRVGLDPVAPVASDPAGPVGSVPAGPVGSDPAAWVAGDPAAPAATDPAAWVASDPAAAVRARAGALLGAWAGEPHAELVSVAGAPMTTGIIAGAGALEVAVHGWDVARACGHDRPLPPALAGEMLDLSALFVTAADRPERFAAPIEVTAGASAGDRLLAFLGRRA